MKQQIHDLTIIYYLTLSQEKWVDFSKLSWTFVMSLRITEVTVKSTSQLKLNIFHIHSMKTNVVIKFSKLNNQKPSEKVDEVMKIRFAHLEIEEVWWIQHIFITLYSLHPTLWKFEFSLKTENRPYQRNRQLI